MAVTGEKGVGLKGWLAGPRAQKEKAPLPIALDRHRVAVLPLSNISPDPNDEYFADGVSDELISTIGKIQGLHVIARTSSTKYKGSAKGISEIGQELRTGSIVEGTVRKAGNRLRITAQLVDVQSEESLWSETYDRELGDVFHIQSDIAKQVAESLQVRLFAANRTRLEKSSTSSAEAFSLYLKGRFHSNRKTEEDYKLSIGFYEQAIRIDPGFALAYAGLAGSYMGLGFQGMIPSKEAYSKARKYVERALALDDSLAEAHRVMGAILRVYAWDFRGAEREINRAIELNPSLADAYGSKAVLIMSRGRFEEAIGEAKRGLELDPLSGRAAGFAGTVFLYSGHHDEAIEQYTRALKIDPNDALARGNLGLTYVRQGQFDIGIREMKKIANVKDTQTQSDLAYAYAKAGRLDELKKLLSELLDEVGNNNELAFAVASAYSNLGEREQALEWLNKAYSGRVSALVTVSHNFVFDNIRSDPRFQALLKKIGYENPQ
jgi:adenylate cyclase